ncbi:unnamed protein product [Fraxinus pennsylvanica]|uniref:DNA-directed RNA polymerase N-terminal domain-containing protein n=1 Tax=Fraxinus pennsylvanica TaxID=56036 RepID=A0AAD2AFZ9_9LAMI|nr:unnamed protein product [Fraxinus pennsylvanica]
MCERKLVQNLPYVKKLILGWFEPLRAAIEKEQKSKRSKKQKTASSTFIDALPADKMAVIVMHKIMGLLMMRGNEDYFSDISNLTRKCIVDESQGISIGMPSDRAINTYCLCANLQSISQPIAPLMFELHLGTSSKLQPENPGENFSTLGSSSLKNFTLVPCYHEPCEEVWVIECDPLVLAGLDGTALDALGNTKWRVNKRILGVVETVWAGGGNIAGLVNREDVSIPEFLLDDLKEVKELKWSVRKVKKINEERHPQICDMELKLSIR